MRNTEKLAAKRKQLEAINLSQKAPLEATTQIEVADVLEETAQTKTISMGTKTAVANPRDFKRPTEFEQLTKQPADKRLRASPTLDMMASFPIQTKIKGTMILISPSTLKEPGVALSIATVITLPLDKAKFKAKEDALAIALTTQSVILAVERIVDIGRRRHNAIELINQLKVKVAAEYNKAKSAMAELAVASQKEEAQRKRANEEQ